MKDGHMAQCESCIQILKKKDNKKKKGKSKGKRNEETDSVRERREKKNRPSWRIRTEIRGRPIEAIYQIHFINISIFVLKSLLKRFQFGESP